MSIALVRTILLSIVFFITAYYLSNSIFSNYFTNNNFFYTEISQRLLIDGKEGAYLYKVGDYLLATDKIILNKKENKEKSVLVSSDSFWNPRVCAQMKNFIVKNENEWKIYFFDTLVVNADEHNGEPYYDVLHIYDMQKNSLTSHKLNKHLNILNINEKEVYVKVGEKNYKAYFNRESLEFENECNFKNCEISEPNLLDILNKPNTNVVEDKPYGLKIFKDNKVIFELNQEEEVYYFLLN